MLTPKGKSVLDRINNRFLFSPRQSDKQLLNRYYLIGQILECEYNLDNEKKRKMILNELAEDFDQQKINKAREDAIATGLIV